MSADTRDALVLSADRIVPVKERDRLYGGKLERSYNRFIRSLRAAPAFLKAVQDELRPGDYFRAVLPPDVQRGLRDGTLAMVHKRSSGLINGMIRKANGRKVIVKQTEWILDTPDVPTLNNLSTLAVHASFAEVTEMLLDLHKKFDSLLAGQHSDRVAHVLTGRALYEQALECTDKMRRAMMLVSAVSSLSLGRQQLMGDLESTLALQPRTPSRWQQLLCWASRGRINEVEFELLHEFEKRYPRLKEDVQYVNLATVYLTRAHVILEQHGSAFAAMNQHARFFRLLTEQLPGRARFLPHEAREGLALPDLINQECGKAQLLVLAAVEPTRDVIIEVPYEELYGNV